jgi:hypothetical protein
MPSTTVARDQENPHADRHGDVASWDTKLRFKKPPPDEAGNDSRTDSNPLGVSGLYWQYTRSGGDEGPPVRRVPWVLDVFLYPTSASGLVNIGIYCVLTFLLEILAPIASYMCLTGFASIVVSVTVIAYIFYYIMECIRDSALGGIRAPANLASMPADKSEAFSQLWGVAGLFIVIWVPVVGYCIYQLFSHASDAHAEYHLGDDATFWLLLGYSIFFFPIGTLAVAMFRSSSAFNPLVWVASIFSTFFQYCGLVLLFCILGWMVSRISFYLQHSLLNAFLFNAVFIYFVLVAAHLLGRFYYRNREKLNWDV